MTLPRLAVLGDSIAAGQGATRRSETLAARLVAGLADADVPVELRVLAVRGARSTGLRPQVDAAVPWPPDLAVLVIGANDVTHFTPLDVAARELGDAVTRLRAAGAVVVVAPAPDLSAVPHVPVALRPMVRAASSELRRRQVLAATAAGARIADADGATAHAFTADPMLFSADRFHPSSAGYAVIARAVLAELRGAVDECRGAGDRSS